MPRANARRDSGSFEITVGSRLTVIQADSFSEIVQSAKLGNAQAFEVIVREYQHEVRLFVRRHLGHVAAADDVAQEVFLQVYRGIGGYSGAGSLRSWILGIARNLVVTYFRREARHLRARQLDLEADVAEWRGAAAEKNTVPGDSTDQDLQALQSCVSELEARQRELIERFYFHGESAEAIAEQSGRKAGAVRMALLRIRNALGKCIRKKRSNS